MAATYPLEVVEAERWQRQNTALTGNALTAALDQQPWDPSIKALATSPRVLEMMDSNLQWTEQLGDAFLANQPAVMDSVQRLRQQAKAAGNLNSTSQQTVSAQGQDILIDPANPQTLYLPYYNPSVVYGTWPYPDYQPYYFPPPPGYVYSSVGVFGFGIGIPLIITFWDWDHWDWRHHHIAIDDERFRHLNHNRPPPIAGVWQHDPAHRHGVPYRNEAVRTQFQHVSEEARRSWRGYGPKTAVTPPIIGRSTEEPRAEAPRVIRGTMLSNNGRPGMSPPLLHPSPQAPSLRSAPSLAPPHRSVPAFESFSRGAEVRAQAARGSHSRSNVPMNAAPHDNSAHSSMRGNGHMQEHNR